MLAVFLNGMLNAQLPLSIPMRRIILTMLAAELILSADLAKPESTPRTQKPQLHGTEWVAITGKPLATTSGASMFLAGGNAVDAACTGAGDDVGHDAQADAALRLDRAEQCAVDRLAAAARLRIVMIGAAGAGQPPHFLGDAMHVDGQADAAIADQREP